MFGESCSKRAEGNSRAYYRRGSPGREGPGIFYTFSAYFTCSKLHCTKEPPSTPVLGHPRINEVGLFSARVFNKSDKRLEVNLLGFFWREKRETKQATLSKESFQKTADIKNKQIQKHKRASFYMRKNVNERGAVISNKQCVEVVYVFALLHVSLLLWLPVFSLARCLRHLCVAVRENN